MKVEFTPAEGDVVVVEVGEKSVLRDVALDPTDDTGALLDMLPCCGWPPQLAGVLGGSIPTTLALINEPPPGVGGVNVLTEIVENSLVVSTGRDVAKGEELYLDYGPRYDRSGYGGGGGGGV